MKEEENTPTKTIFERGSSGRCGFSLPELVSSVSKELFVPKSLARKQYARLPELGESEIVRHYIGLSSKNFHVDKGFYPLGSCTMKYNPKINDEIAGLPGFSQIHPEQPVGSVQGALEVYYELERILSEISGLAAISLQPAAGAHGELTGMLMMRAYHKKKNQYKSQVLIPDSAHGTNPASAKMAGFEVVQLPSGKDGRIDLHYLGNILSNETAGIMVTNPNTLGLYENQIKEVTRMVHDVDGLVYMDGANFNAIVGNARPGDVGIDIMHFNLHKTFSTPHGGGGPGAGPVGVIQKLEPFLPLPRVQKNDKGVFFWNDDLPDSIGRMHGYWGNYLILVRAYTYLLMMGQENLAQISKDAILNTNYLLHLLKDKWEPYYPGPVAHEVVLSAKPFKAYNVRALDIAKRLIELGYHPPTIYFPLIVPEALMIEPTEAETKETMEAFADAMNQIANEATEHPEKLREAPRNTPVQRLDEAKAAKELKVKAI